MLSSSSSSSSSAPQLFVSAHGDTNEKAMTPVDLERPLAAQFDPAVNWLVLRRRAARKGLMSSLRSVARRNTISFLEHGSDRNASEEKKDATSNNTATNATNNATNSSQNNASTAVSGADKSLSSSTAAAGAANSASTTPADPQFGRPIEQVMARVGGLPAVVRRCVAHVEQYGLAVEGIYRMSGSAAKIAELKQLVDNGGDLWFSSSSAIHDVSGLLKLFLRELPDGVVTSRLYPYFISAAMCREGGEPLFAFLRAAVMALPKYNLMLLEFLVRHLARVSTCTETKMHVNNLATVFAPSVMRAEEMRATTHSGLAHQATVLLIENVGEAFNLRKSVPFSAAAIAEHGYAPPAEDAEAHLLFDAGDVIYFTARPDGDDWWPAVTADGRRGLVPKNYVRVEIDYDEIEGQATVSTQALSPRGAEDSEALRLAVAQRAERDALRSELKAAAPGIAVVRSASPKTSGADDALTKILELQDRQAALLAQRKEASTAAARIVQLQQAHQGTLARRESKASAGESNSDRGSSRDSSDNDAAPGMSASPARRISRKNSLQSAAAIVRNLIGGSPLASSTDGGLERASSASSKKKKASAVSTSPARLLRASSQTSAASTGSTASPSNSPRPIAPSSESEEPTTNEATAAVAEREETPPPTSEEKPRAPTSPPPSALSPRGAALLLKSKSPDGSPTSSPRRRKRTKKKSTITATPIETATNGAVAPAAANDDDDDDADGLAAALLQAEERSVVDSALSAAEDKLEALRADSKETKQCDDDASASASKSINHNE